MEEEALEERRRAVNDLSEREYQLWRHQPVTRAFLVYLTDYAATVMLNVLDAFIAGGLSQQEDTEARGRIKLARELVELPWNDIRASYGLPPEKEQT